MNNVRLVPAILALGCIMAGCSSIPGSTCEGDTDPDPVDFVLKANPLVCLLSFDVDDFEAADAEEEGELDGVASYMPSVLAGVGINTAENWEIELTVGPGWLWNKAFDTPFLRLDGAARHRLGGGFSAGPHVGVIAFAEPDWNEDVDVDLDSTIGFYAGVDAAYRLSEAVSLTAAIDYFSAVFDAEAGEAGVTVNDDEIDLSGIVLQIQALFRF